MTIRVKLSETGEIALPKDMRDARGWAAGMELELVDQGGGLVLRPVYERSAHPPSRVQIEAFLAARVKIDRPFPTEDEIDRVLTEDAGKQFVATFD